MIGEDKDYVGYSGRFGCYTTSGDPWSFSLPALGHFLTVDGQSRHYSAYVYHWNLLVQWTTHCVEDHPSDEDN